ncbi:hypothetical protein ACWEFJ_02825 [Actinosynnema sp. NPDC004786]
MFSPPATIAMRGIPPALSGAASGLFNMTRLGGSLLGAAAVGAVLQSRLAASFAEVEGLPGDVGTAVRRSVAGAEGVDLAAVRDLGGPSWDTVFQHAVLDAVRWTYLLPVAIVVAGALGALAVRVRAPDAVR